MKVFFFNLRQTSWRGAFSKKWSGDVKHHEENMAVIFFVMNPEVIVPGQVEWIHQLEADKVLHWGRGYGPGWSQSLTVAPRQSFIVFWSVNCLFALQWQFDIRGLIWWNRPTEADRSAPVGYQRQRCSTPFDALLNDAIGTAITCVCVCQCVYVCVRACVFVCFAMGLQVCLFGCVTFIPAC